MKSLEDSVHIYLREEKACSQYLKPLADGVSVNNCSSLSLADYSRVRSDVCTQMHNQPCTTCPPLLKVANKVLNDFVLCDRHLT